MNGDRAFVRALADYLALHTEQSSGHLTHLIEAFLRGAQGHSKLDPAAKTQVANQLKADMAAFDGVPSFLQNYLLTHLSHDEWPPQATFLASRYLQRQAGERFVPWQRRQQLIAELESEPIRGTELGFRQFLYGQGAGTTFSWRGVPCFKASYDIAIYAMLIDELRPGTIVELGAGAGGSSLFFADLCVAAGLATRIVSIDNTIAKISDPRIAFVQSDCSDWLATAAKSKPDLPRPWLLIEDFHGDLGGFIEDIDLVLEAEDYLVIEDSYSKQKRIAEVMAKRPYLIDSKYTDFFGVNCTSAINSIFVKNTDTSATDARTRRESQLRREQDRAWRQRNERGA